MGNCCGKEEYKTYYCSICDKIINGEMKLFVRRGKIDTICSESCKLQFQRKYNR